MGDVYHRRREERRDGDVGARTRRTPDVVPAKAGTHNPRELFGEDSWSGIATVRNRDIARYGFRPSPGRQQRFG